MTDLPISGYFSDANRTVGEMKQAFEDQRDVISELLGGQARSVLTIATGSITPTAGVHSIDTEGGATTDDLTHIDYTNTPDGRLLLIRAENTSRVVVVKHAAGGNGQILLKNSADITLNNTKDYILLRREGTAWEEVLSSVVTGDLSVGNITSSGTVTATGNITGANLSGTNTGDEVAATTTTQGIVELATQTEVDTGTDTTRVVTPSTLKNASFLGTAKITFGTTVATTSGTSVTITDVPASVMATFIVINQMSTDNSSSDWDIQLGTASGIETTGYTGAVLGAVVGNTPSGRTSSTSFPFFYNTAFFNTDLLQGCIRLYRKASGSNIWIAEGIVGKNSSATNYMTTGTKTLSGELTQIRISTTAGNFDNGDITPIYFEG